MTTESNIMLVFHGGDGQHQIIDVNQFDSLEDMANDYKAWATAHQGAGFEFVVED